MSIYAYRRGYSCYTQLLVYQNELAEFINGEENFDVIMFDFKSVSELKTHSKLLKSFASVGAGAKLRKWIEAFLSRRTFRVAVNKALSGEAKITSGCPQGTIPGCLAYVIYTNSLKDVLPSGVAYKVYADDTKINAKVNNAADHEKLQNAINNFIRWTDSQDLKLSVQKCLVMHCGKKTQHHTYKIKDEALSATTSARDLGVIFTPDFKFSEHVREVGNKMARQANFIMRTFALTDAEVYGRLFKTYIQPILSYSSPVWNPSLKKDLNLLQAVVNKFRRRVAISAVSIDRRLKKLTSPSFSRQRTRNCFTRFYRIQICETSFSTESIPGPDQIVCSFPNSLHGRTSSTKCLIGDSPDLADCDIQ